MGLIPVLGSWVLTAQADGSGPLWTNEVLGLSSWKDPRRTTNLFKAAFDGNLWFLQLYNKAEGSLDIVDSKGRTAMHCTCAGGSIQAVLHLLANKANADALDLGGSTPLHLACRYGHDSIVKILLDAGANIDHQNSLGDTALHEVAALDRIVALQSLLAARANATLRNRESKTPADVALRSRAGEAAELLRNREKHQLRRTRNRTLEHPGEQESDEMVSSVAPLQAMGFTGGQSCGSRALVPPHSDSDSDNESDRPDPSLVLLFVHAARRLLQGVQRLVQRVLGEKIAAFGDGNRYKYDTQTGQWVLSRPKKKVDLPTKIMLKRWKACEKARWRGHAGAPDECEDSVESDEEEEEEDQVAPPPPPVPVRRRYAPSRESDGMAGV